MSETLPCSCNQGMFALNKTSAPVMWYLVIVYNVGPTTALDTLVSYMKHMNLTISGSGAN